MIHIFNPDTDYALASNMENYTPPVSVLAIKRSLALLPALFADKGDAILMPPDTPETLIAETPFVNLVSDKDMQIILPKDLPIYIIQHPGERIRPWGWNKTLRKWLRGLDTPNLLLPTEDEINTLRSLSHRRLTIPFLLNMGDMRNEEISIPKEFTSLEEAMEYWMEHADVYFKAPWSSSGRGILFTKDLEKRHIEPWLRGIIRAQGSVMGEIAYARKLDFATEWECRDGRAMFVGVSTFVTSERGKYKSNVVLPQENIVAYVLQNIKVYDNGNNLSDIIERQRLLLENYVAPFYEGPLGIDMLVTKDGNVNPCVEINLRNTMGRVAVDIQHRIMSEEASETEVKFLTRLTRGGIFSPMHLLSTLRDIESN